MSNTKQHEEGWLAYCENNGDENPYTKPEWAAEWDRGYYEARMFNKGL